ncbi:MAG: BREX-1 system phosphatase PglZ type A, partial [Bacillota bacterium]|nr:BREX-1 system phosphatase PglZ type A [Bacillota bacterium]
LLKLGTNNAFQIKHQVEKADLKSNYLIYSPYPKPLSRENWLIDILKYSREFSTDKAVLIMRDLGVNDQALVNTFRKYLKFFDNKERYRKFATYNLEIYSVENVDIAVLSVLCRLPVADFEQVLRKVLSGETESENKYLQAIKAFGDPEAFWKLVEKHFGYGFEEHDLGKLMLMLLVTHASYSLREKLPQGWQPFVSTRKTDSMLFIDAFINHAADSKYYESLANKGEEILKVKEYALKWDLEQYLQCHTFKAFDAVIIGRIKQNLLEGVGEFDRYKNVINERRTSYWFKQLSAEYDCLYFAVELFAAEKRLSKELKNGSAHELYQQYTEKYYLVDYYYRKFYLHYDHIPEKELFAELADKVEKSYKHWFLDELAVKWSEALENELASGYPIAAVSQQQRFFNDNIGNHLRNEERVFVIVSDALRYEVGQELQTLLNNEIRGSATIASMQGVVPSTTKMGMATLLPHRAITINEQGEVYADGIHTHGTENRGKILTIASKDAVAVQFERLIEMKKADYRELLQGTKLVYIYHNVIDATGDDSHTERQVFEATEKALRELLQLVRNLVHNLSATNIYITADHGFIYSRSPLQESDKVSKYKTEALAEGRRFMLAATEENPPGTLAVAMNYLLGEDSKLKALVPKGVIRYKVPGAGANYVHGGAALQEIVLPVIKFKYLRKDEYRATKVSVKLASISRKITNRITFLEFLQTDRVEDKKLPLKLKLYFADEQGERISNENIIIADSKAEDASERKYREKFTLKSIAFERGKQYYLVLEDEDEQVEKIYEKIPFAIDLLISDDFNL